MRAWVRYMSRLRLVLLLRLLGRLFRVAWLLWGIGLLVMSGRVVIGVERLCWRCGLADFREMIKAATKRNYCVLTPDG